MPVKAILWDVDGVLAETERDGHRVAFNRAFEAHGLSWRWSVEHYGELLAVTGGRERLMHDMRNRADAPQVADERDKLARALHKAKNQFYAELVRTQGLPLREGVQSLLQACRKRGLRMAVTTTTSRSNLDALMHHHFGADWATGFDAVVCGEDVAQKKPDPDVYLQALKQLDLGPLETLAIEDSPGGVAAARAAHVPVVVTRSIYFANATLDGAVAIGPGLGQRQGWRPALPDPDAPGPVTLDDLIDWHQRMELTSQFG